MIRAAAAMALAVAAQAAWADGSGFHFQPEAVMPNCIPDEMDGTIVCAKVERRSAKAGCDPVQINGMIFSCEAPTGQNCGIAKHVNHKGKLLPQYREGGGTAGTGLCWARGHDPRYGEPPCAIDIGNHPSDPNFGHIERCSKVVYTNRNAAKRN